MFFNHRIGSLKTLAFDQPFDARQPVHLFRLDVARELSLETLRIMMLTVRYALIAKNPEAEFGRPGRGFCFIEICWHIEILNIKFQISKKIR
jgi:hypothetical protein